MRLPVGTAKANISALMLLLALVAVQDVDALEKPEYQVLNKEGKIEYRLYQPYVLVETEVSNEDYMEATEIGFDRLFGYISGDNQSQEKISMTAPVEMARTGQEIQPTSPVQTSQTLEGIRMSFMLPSEYTAETAPIPTDSNVVLKKLPERVVAAIRFSGRWTERNLTKNEARLIENIQQAELQTAGPSVFAAYNPPFMPPWFRRNEILFEIVNFPTEGSYTN